MISYCDAINNIAAAKRMGFHAEFINKQGLKAFISYARQKLNAKYNRFDPLGSETGEFDNSWKLRFNISKENLFKICN